MVKDKQTKGVNAEMKLSMEVSDLKVLEAQFDSVKKKIDILQETMDRCIAQLDSDRKDLSDIKLNTKIARAVSEGTREDVHKQTESLADKVDEHLEPVPDIIGNQISKEIKKKKVISYNFKNRGIIRNFLAKWF